MISEILKALLGSPDLSATGTGGMQPTPTPAGPTGPVTKLDTEASSPQDLARRYEEEPSGRALGG